RADIQTGDGQPGVVVGINRADTQELVARRHVVEEHRARGRQGAGGVGGDVGQEEHPLAVRRGALAGLQGHRHGARADVLGTLPLLLAKLGLARLGLKVAWMVWLTAVRVLTVMLATPLGSRFFVPRVVPVVVSTNTTPPWGMTEARPGAVFVTV